jgi:hypothetical protein
MSRLGGEVVDEAMLLDAYDAHLQILENRPKTTAGTYRSHVKGFLRYLAINYPSVTLSEVTKLQVRAWFLHEANRGIAPVTRSTKLFADGPLQHRDHKPGTCISRMRISSTPSTGRSLKAERAR